MDYQRSSKNSILLPDYLVKLISDNPKIYSGHPNSIWKALDSALEKLEIQHFNPHKLRHYYASICHDMGIPEAQIMAGGGWKSSQVLRSVYPHAMPESEAEYKHLIASHLEHLYA